MRKSCEFEKAQSFEKRKALVIGTFCAVSYLAVYFSRNILGIVSPVMIDGKIATAAQIGGFSSLHFIAYAGGQLVNGVLGDRIKPKYMISSGLFLGGVCCAIFPLCFDRVWIASLAYALMGFVLSMIYAPTVKLISENTLPTYAVYCCIALQFASNFAAPAVGILAALLRWNELFIIGGALLASCGAVMFLFLVHLERREYIRYIARAVRTEKRAGSAAILIKNGIIKFSVIAAVTGTIRTTLVFWLPTYISQRLSFSPSTSALIYTAAGIVISLNAFASTFLYRFLKKRMRPTLMICFLTSAASLLAANFIQSPIPNLFFMISAIFASNCADSIMWNVYCPGLRDTGLVSTATGYLDFVSYMAASVASPAFSKVVESFGWNAVIIICFILICVGGVASFPEKKS